MKTLALLFVGAVAFAMFALAMFVNWMHRVNDLVVALEEDKTKID